MRVRPEILLSFLLLCAVGCGSGVAPGFSLQVTPGMVTVQNSGSGQPLAVLVTPAGGFSGTVTLTLAGLPAGVTATPTSLSVAPGSSGQFLLAATTATVAAGTALTVTGTAGSVSAHTTATLAVLEALSSATVGTAAFDFGANLVGATLTRSVATVTNTGSTPITLSPALSGDPSYSLVASQSCGDSLAAGASCMETVAYAPVVASGATPQTATLNLGLGNVAAATPQTVALTGVSAVLPPGTVTPSANPLVAIYTQKLPFPGSVAVQFGPDTTYGRQTSLQTTTTDTGSVTTLVAGMRQNTSYHLRTVVQLANGAVAYDADHTFANGASELQPNLSADTIPGATPQPGVEQLTLVTNPIGLVVTDLQGYILWSYKSPLISDGPVIMDGVELLANGHYLVTIEEGSGYNLGAQPAPPSSEVRLQEIDLVGNNIRSMSIPELTSKLQSAGYDLQLEQFHHEIKQLPNGNLLILSNTLKSFTDLPGYPGQTNVLGDVIVELDTDWNPVWVWNSFDHLDVNRHPFMFPDWTHSNALLYSPSDHQLIISMRHQNWVMKLDFKDGTGSGDILWRLGEGGDFTLVNGTDPTDWNYAQHFPSLFSANSSGVFSLGLMDNGNDRQFPAGVACGTAGQPACQYTTIPVFQLDEGAKTATLVFHQVLDPSLYSQFGGNTNLLANGNYEYDLAGSGSTNSDIFEVTPDSKAPQIVWHLHSQGTNAYRGYRIPSLYPGVQW